MVAFKSYLTRIVDFSDDELELLMGKLSTISLKKSDFFVRQNTICNKIGFVLEGILEMNYLSDDETESALEFVFANNFITDYVSFLTQTPSDCNIPALSDCTIAYFHKEDLECLYESNFNYQKLGRIVAENYFVSFANRIKQSKLSPKQRYDELLKTNPLVLQAVPQYKIASYLGISAEWLSKLRRLE